MDQDLRVLLIGYHLSREATGEGFSAFKWAEALSERVKLTVLTQQAPRHSPIQEQLPGAEVVTWPQPRLARSFPRFNAMLKPDWFVFARHVDRFLQRAAGRFDVAHQIMPQAMRYPSPLRGHGLPYVIGPLGGALETPSGFAAEATSASWFTRLRKLDRLRLRRDPWLRASYAGADLMLGVAPYVGETLKEVPLRRYGNVLELGVSDVAPRRPPRKGDGLRLLHVGRGVRTKGLRDAVRALAYLEDLPGITLVSAGAGEEIEICRKEAEALGVADRVTFRGRLRRDEIENLYAASDVFVFPSFREPAGNVVYEAMRWSLPLVAADRGGPGFVVDDSCGIKVAVTDTERMPRDVAAAIRRLYQDPGLRHRLGEGGRAKVETEGLWPNKAAGLVTEYHRILEDRAATRVPERRESALQRA